MTLLEYIPTFTSSTSLEKYRAVFDSVQCVCFKGVNANSNERKRSNTRKRKRTRKHKQSLQSTSEEILFDLQKHVLDTFNSATAKDQGSWTIENDSDILDSSTSASEFLSPAATQNGYCSFVMQDDSSNAVSNFTEQLTAKGHPTTLPVGGQLDSLYIASPYWLFFCRNNTSTAMKGRNEHTDDIDHNGGTFHYQVAGTKTWTIRPTEKMRDKCDELDIALKKYYVQTVEEGDVFVINTRLWWHQTEIPGLSGAGKGRKNGKRTNLSMSYARDICLDGTQPVEGGELDMNNKDAGWASAFIAKGTVLHTQADPPVVRTAGEGNVNCELFVAGNNEEGEIQMALRMTKELQEGDYFTILEESESEGGDY